MYITAYIAVMMQTYPRGSKAKFALTAIPCQCLYCIWHVPDSFNSDRSKCWILQIKPSPISLLQGSKRVRQNSRPDSGPRSIPIPRPYREARAGPAREHDRLVTLLERGFSTFYL